MCLSVEIPTSLYQSLRIHYWFATRCCIVESNEKINITILFEITVRLTDSFVCLLNKDNYLLLLSELYLLSFMVFWATNYKSGKRNTAAYSTHTKCELLWYCSKGLISNRNFFNGCPEFLYFNNEPHYFRHRLKQRWMAYNLRGKTPRKYVLLRKKLYIYIYFSNMSTFIQNASEQWLKYNGSGTSVPCLSSVVNAA